MLDEHGLEMTLSGLQSSQQAGGKKLIIFYCFSPSLILIYSRKVAIIKYVNDYIVNYRCLIDYQNVNYLYSAIGFEFQVRG